MTIVGRTLTAGTVVGMLAGFGWPGCTTEMQRDPALASPSQEGTAGSGQPDEFTRLRATMVDRQILARGIRDDAVLAAMRKVPRHEFVPGPQRPYAYEDTPLPIGYEQTISQPYIVAYMTDALQPSADHKVLEVGTGSGYQAAVLAELVRHVYTIEIVPELAERARGTLQRLGYDNVHVRTGNGYLGWPEHAPYDRIMVTAAPEEVPPALIDQLAVGGILVIPVGSWFQQMTVIHKTPDGIVQRQTLPVRFVPMTGKP